MLNYNEETGETMIVKSKTRFDGRVAGGKTEWLTPPTMVEALGAFELDPCSAVNMPWVLARDAYTTEQDGLLHDWRGRVFMNPPYQTPEAPCKARCTKKICKERGWHTDKYIPGTEDWMRRLAAHGEGIALTFARTETGTFFPYVWDNASAIYFIKGRIKFYNVDGTLGDYSGGAPSVLIAYGNKDSMLLDLAQPKLKAAGWGGKYIRLK